MEINKEVFLEVVKKINKIGDDVPMLFDEKGITTSGITPDHAMIARCFLPVSKIKDYNPVGMIGVNLTDLSKFVGRFSSVIKLETDKNIMSMIEGRKEAKLKLLNPDFIDENKKESLIKDFELGDMFVFDISSSLLKQTIEDINAVNKLKETVIVRFDVKGKDLTIDVSGSENNLKRTITLTSESKEDIHVVFSGELLSTLLSMITADKMTVHLKSDYPIKVLEHTAMDIDVLYVIAPRMDDNEITPENEKIEE